MFTEEINRGINWVLRVQNSDGGWGGPFKEYTWSGAWTTAGVLYILAKAEKKEEVLNAIFRGLSWLGKYQNKDGGFPRVQYDLSSVDATSFSIICFKALEESEGFIKTNITTTIHLMLKEAKNYLLKAALLIAFKTSFPDLFTTNGEIFMKFGLAPTMLTMLILFFSMFGNLI